MTFGSGPQALVDHIEANWQASRTGRPDVPDLAKRNASTGNYGDARGVVVFHDREEVAVDNAVHDLIHVYHPQGGGITFTDTGYKEKNVVEAMQIDIDVTDRTDGDTGERLYARNRLVGDRDDPAFPTDETPPYPGLFGEVVYILEGIRRRFEEWDVARMSVVGMTLKNSQANISLDVELEHIAANTVQ